jgi:hypothetical protein
MYNKITNSVRASLGVIFSQAKTLAAIALFGIIPLLGGCDYLDVVPENIPTIDHAFRNRTEAQRYLYGLYSFMPDVGNFTQDPALFGGDEIWITVTEQVLFNSSITSYKRIAMGEQGTQSPFADYWRDKRNGGGSLWTALSDINFFLENIDKPFDLPDYEREKWIGEVLFLKAYLHFWLFRQYGPIPLIKDNMSQSTGTDEIQRYREPVDECVDYICELLDQATEKLPLTIEDQGNEMGRPDKCIALALKAQVLTCAASPLFNCNPDYADFKDKRGVALFPQDKSEEKEKWQRAADALKIAIETSHEGLHKLYDFRNYFSGASLLSDSTVLAMQVRGAVTECWNDEVIWGNPRINRNYDLQRMCSPLTALVQDNGGASTYNYAPTLRMVEQFYTKNGIPIEDDREWTGKDLWGLQTATAEHRQYIRQGFQTINLHFDREPRFYGAITFDGSTFYGMNRITSDNATNPQYLWLVELKYGTMNGFHNTARYSYTGYICKKLAHFRSAASETSATYTAVNYAFPIIRLADLYLMYAEALNEAKDAPDTEVYEYIDLVRARTGLKGVVESWDKYAVEAQRKKPLSKEGMRDIIRRERLNEFAFEGQRFWDIRRWKTAEILMNQPARGLDIYGATAEEFYRPVEIFPLKWEKKDYFWPISIGAILANQHLVQNPGW